MKIGDKVRIITDENNDEAQSFLSDLEADMRADLADRYMDGKEYDKITNAIVHRKPWVIVADATEDEGFELKLDGEPFIMSYRIDGEFLEPA